MKSANFGVIRAFHVCAFLILDDNNVTGSPNIASGGNIQHVDISTYGNHTQVDDPSSGIWPEIWKWMDNPDYQVPFPQVLP